MRILLLTSSTGGGHDMRAKAFKAWAEKLTYWEIEVHQTLENTHPLYHFGVRLYNRIQKTLPALHHLYFNYLEAMSMHRRSNRILGAANFRAFTSTFKPDLVLSTHAHLNHGFFDLARQTAPDSPPRCVTYCGELSGGYGFSKHWVNPHADLFIGAVDDTVAAARALGALPEKSLTGGFLLQPHFYEAPPDSTAKDRFLSQEMGMDPKAFTLLLCTGAVGANNHLALLKHLESRKKPTQVIALCGSNKRTFEAIENWRHHAKHVTVKPLPFWERMPLLLRSVNAAIARPGTGTFSEAILCGCPLIMNGIGGIMPQENITLKYAARHELDIIIRQPRQLGPLLDSWQADPEKLTRHREKLRALRPEKNPADILEIATDTPSDAR